MHNSRDYKITPWLLAKKKKEIFEIISKAERPIYEIIIRVC